MLSCSVTNLVVAAGSDMEVAQIMEAVLWELQLSQQSLSLTGLQQMWGEWTKCLLFEVEVHHPH